MEYEILEKQKGTEIRVYTDNKTAIVVQGEEERIYLPQTTVNHTSYYEEAPEQLVKFDGGYKVLHKGPVDNITVLN